MIKKKLLVLTEGGEEVGFGHITRTISISSKFSENDYEIEFIINGDNSILSLLQGFSYELFDWQKSFKKLLNSVNLCDLVLVDSMKIKNEELLLLEQTNIPIIYIDDEKRRNVLNKGFVIDWTVLSDEKNYFLPKKEKIKYLLGSKFTPLRPEFSKAKTNTINNEIKSIMITFGGSDVRDLTPRVIETLIKYFPSLQKNIIIGAGFKNIEKIKTICDENCNLVFNVTTNDMIKVMQESDIAIASGGQTLYELARIGTPTIGIILVDNAVDDTLGWECVGSLINISWWNEKDLDKKLVDAVDSLKSKEKRVFMQKSAKKYISKNGAEFIFEEVMKGLKDDTV